MDFATALNVLIESAIAQNMAKYKASEVEELPINEFIASETIGEVIDKLLIVNIRTWHLEDQVDGATDEELLDIQRKLRHCFRVKRPRLVAALNQMLRVAIQQGRLDLVQDEYVKTYKGQDEIRSSDA